MRPAWQGIQLDIPDSPGKAMEELVFFIGNKRAGQFRLEIDSIILQQDI